MALLSRGKRFEMSRACHGPLLVCNLAHVGCAMIWSIGRRYCLLPNRLQIVLQGYRWLRSLNTLRQTRPSRVALIDVTKRRVET
jgi:hypothetical protein